MENKRYLVFIKGKFGIATLLEEKDKPKHIYELKGKDVYYYRINFYDDTKPIEESDLNPFLFILMEIKDQIQNPKEFLSNIIESISEPWRQLIFSIAEKVEQLYMSLRSRGPRA